MRIPDNPRLRELYQLYNKVCDTILGHPYEDRKDLLTLKARVVEEIKAIEQAEGLNIPV